MFSSNECWRYMIPSYMGSFIIASKMFSSLPLPGKSLGVVRGKNETDAVHFSRPRAQNK